MSRRSRGCERITQEERLLMRDQTPTDGWVPRGLPISRRRGVAGLGGNTAGDSTNEARNHRRHRREEDRAAPRCAHPEQFGKALTRPSSPRGGKSNRVPIPGRWREIAAAGFGSRASISRFCSCSGGWLGWFLWLGFSRELAEQGECDCVSAIFLAWTVLP